MRTLAQATTPSGFDTEYLRRSAARLDHLADADGRSVAVRRVARALMDPSRSWAATVSRAWQWLPTHYVEERVGDRWQLSSETLARKLGDCEDWSVLLAAALKANRVDCRLLTIPQHVAVAVRVPLRDVIAGTKLTTAAGWDVYSHRGQIWLFLESTFSPADRRGRLPGWGVDHIATFANSQYLQIAGSG